MDKLLTFEDVANILQIGIDDVQAHFEAGRLKGIDVGVKKPELRFSGEDVKKCLDTLRHRTQAVVSPMASAAQTRVPLPGVYRLNIKTDGVDPKAFCLKEGIAGMGWAIEDADHPLDWDEYLQKAPAKYPNGKWKPVIDFHDIPNGSAIWTRSGSKGNTVFWVGLVTGPWRYRHDPEAYEADVANVRPVKWQKIGGYGDVPEAIARAFTPATFAPIKQQEGVEFTESLAAKFVAAGVWPALSEPHSQNRMEAILQKAWGAWGRMSREEIDHKLAAVRDEWERDPLVSGSEP